MVGYVMVVYDYDIPEYDIWHMQMDRNCQNRGYGKQALKRVLDYISSKPFGFSNKVTLTCHKDDRTAYHLYASMGFAPTGVMDEDPVMVATSGSALVNYPDSKESRLVTHSYGPGVITR